MQTKQSNWKKLLIIIAGILAASLTISCTDTCSDKMTYVEYTPQYVKFEDMRASFTVLPPQPIEESGKIYLYGTTLFVTEPDSGIHVIDNSNPSIPIHKNFVKLAGVHDVAVKGSTMYADSYMDLVLLDISDVTNIQHIKRIENVFANQYYYSTESGDSFIAGYTETARVQMDASDCDRAAIIRQGDVLFMDVWRAETLAATSGAGSVSGISGSMARMNIVGDYLYGIDVWALNVFDVTNENEPQALEDVYVGWGIETLFPYGDNLFIGAADGLYIFDNSTPTAPTFLSKFNHARACDPVVVKDDIAFVTLRDGTECDGFANQLDVVDVSDLLNPTLLYSYEMDNPHGLGVNGDNLFICEGTHGLKLFDKSDLSAIGSNMKNWIRDIDAYDVIPLDGGLLIMIGEDGLYQFDYTDPSNIRLLSVILTK
jgi:hypothetical protein